MHVYFDLLILDLDIMTNTFKLFCPSIHPNLVWASTQKLYMTTISYFQGRSILHGTCALSGYCVLLTFTLENMIFTLNNLFGPLLTIINGICFIFSGISIYHWKCALQGYFDLLTFNLDIMTVILTFLSWPLFGNYQWQVLHIFRVYQPYMNPVHCRVILTISTRHSDRYLEFFYLAHCSETINNNCFIFSGRINIT